MTCDVVKCAVEDSLLNNATSIITVFVSVVNLLFIIWIYFKDKNDKKENKIKEYKYDWFKMISINDRIENLNKMISSIKKESEEIYNSKEKDVEKRNELMNNKLSIINSSFFNEKNSYNYLLKCIDEQSNIDITILYNDFQEEYYQILTKSVAKQDFSFDKLIDISSSISGKYYEIGIKLIK